MSNRRKLTSPDGIRSALVYERRDVPGRFLVQVSKFPESHDHMADDGRGQAYWWGGHLLWDHERDNMAEAVEVANRWVVDGEVPSCTCWWRDTPH